MRTGSRRWLAAIVVFICLPCSDNVLAADVVDFERDVATVLIKRCVECHRGDEKSGGLDLTSQQGLKNGGDSGAVVDTQDAAESYLLQRVTAGEMPPEAKGQSQKIPADEISILRRWIEQGASWPSGRKLSLFERTTEVRAGRDWWSLQPIQRAEVPLLKSRPQPNHPIDALIGKRLEDAGMIPAPRADKRVLIRRLYYDLLGLPPTPREIADYLADDSPDAWEKLIDELLDRPQYGERWARYWLDLARYAETSGYERDQEKPFAWKYRDWVVRAFNDDLPFADFVTCQLAGDEIENRTEQSVVATGFLRLGTWNDEPNDAADYQYDRLEDLVHTTSSTFLALTVKCARCHTHKFDPIHQDDYYRMGAAFWAGPVAARDRSLLGGPSADELGVNEVLGWTDLARTARPLHVLKNGERAHPLHEVKPGSLSSIAALARDFEPPPDDARTTRRRLQLAHWIADPANPLPARVYVNRLWQHHFGEAIVRTPNNFGFLADPPTHPALLDWLASEFLARGGSTKAIHKLILTSETWRQSSIHPQASRYEKMDSGNRLWWRAERRRLDAEALRDSMLHASGEIDLTIGGPSFKASISPEALEGLSRKSAAWQASPPDAQNRRSLYMYMKRGLLPPLMTTFDLCDATLPVGQRDVTTVPTQALALLNNRFVHDRSRALAIQVTGQTANVDRQVRSIWSAILKRDPSSDELELAKTHLTRQRATFAIPENSDEMPESATVDRDELAKALVLHLRADRAATEEGTDRVRVVKNLSDSGHDALQDVAAAQPTWVRSLWNDQPALQFNGDGQFLRLVGQPLREQHCTMIAVASDRKSSGHREIISNWHRSSNVGSSLFLGLTGEKTVRFSDVFASAGEITDRGKPFILTATNAADHAAVFQSGRRVARKDGPLATRKLDTPWVIGQQGNINGEFWSGAIAEIRIYNRALNDAERRDVEQELAERYGIDLAAPTNEQETPLSPDVLALASLCHVLWNSNEFIYVD